MTFPLKWLFGWSSAITFLIFSVLTPEPPCVCADSSHNNLSPAQADSVVEGAAAALQITLDLVAPLKNKKVRGGVPPSKIPRLGSSNKKWEFFLRKWYNGRQQSNQEGHSGNL